MRTNVAVDEAINKDYMPVLSLRAYDVSYASGYCRELTRNAAKDITADYIDMNSIHYEVSQISGDYFEPGAVIPAKLSLRVLPGHGLTLEESPAPQSPADYSVVYRPVIQYMRPNGTVYTTVTTFPYLIIVSRTSDYDGETIKLNLQDELCVLDNVQIDAASYNGETGTTLISAAMTAAGLAGPKQSGGSSSGITGTSLPTKIYYSGEEMSCRQAISYVLQMNGCFAIMNENGALNIKRMMDNATDGGNWPYVFDAELSADYVMDYYVGEYEPNKRRWTNVRVFPSDVTPAKGNFPRTYILKDNPFIAEGNAGTYEALLRNRIIKELSFTGAEFEYRFNTNIELGDYVLARYYQSPNTTNARDLLVSRIEWDGGAFCKLRGPDFKVNNRT